jgi:hypothetical protein
MDSVSVPELTRSPAALQRERVEIDHAGTGIFEDLAFAVACEARRP